MTRSEVVMIAGMALATFLIRYPVLWLVGRYRLPDSWLRALRFVPPAVLSALVTPALLFPTGTTFVSPIANPYLVAGITAAVVAWKQRSLLLTLAVGMSVFWIWRWLLWQYL
jgi:branched-subunit amino acid transport protein